MCQELTWEEDDGGRNEVLLLFQLSKVSSRDLLCNIMLIVNSMALYTLKFIQGGSHVTCYHNKTKINDQKINLLLPTLF